MQNKYKDTLDKHKNIGQTAIVEKEKTDSKIQQLEELESQLIQNLRQTTLRKEKVIEKLGSKSKSLAKSIQPRKAYSYRSPANKLNS